jgi:phospholipid transport system substrate-binding protein
VSIQNGTFSAERRPPRVFGCGVQKYASPQTLVRPCSAKKWHIFELDTLDISNRRRLYQHIISYRFDRVRRNDVKKKIFVVLLSVMVCLATPALAQDPQVALKAAIDKGIAILTDPRYKGEDNKALQREKFWTELKDVFDFSELSRRALARNWRRFSTQEQQAFVDVFSELLGNTYVEKIQEGFENQKVVYLSQEVSEKNRAVVKTMINDGNTEIPVDYKMHNEAGPWKVYDVYVEGISLVQNYRTQFNKFLVNKSPGQLIQRLQDKVKGLKS